MKLYDSDDVTQILISLMRPEFGGFVPFWAIQDEINTLEKKI